MKEDMIKARDEYINLIKQELLGPGSEYSIPDKEHELITNRPEIRYSIGILFPQNNEIKSENDESMRLEEVDTTEDFDKEELDTVNETPRKLFDKILHDENDADEENLDEEISLAAQNLPSSMGITFFIQGVVKNIVCNVEFATYRKAMLSDCRISFVPKDPKTYEVPLPLRHFLNFDSKNNLLNLTSSIQKKEIYRIKESDTVLESEVEIFDYIYKLFNQLKTGYVRIPHSLNINLNFSKGEYIDNNRKLDGTNAKITALRRNLFDDIYSVTIMLVNDLEDLPNGINCIMQSQISLSTDQNAFSFYEYNNIDDLSNMDEEEQTLALLYRKKKVFGSGLGTSINWSVDDMGKGKLFSNYFPEYEVPTVDFRLPSQEMISPNALSMKFLSDLNDTAKETKLEMVEAVIKSYENWIANLLSTAKTLPNCYQSQAYKNIKKCKYSCQRMHEGIEILRMNEKAWSSFQLSNRAMFMQRVHLNIMEETSNLDRYPYDDELSDILESVNYINTNDIYFWRPFQMAFILMNIESITEDGSEERSIVDLIWFPTGGGKTEAYLGLSAFTIFYRRLNYLPKASGTTVIMRYTLRLLTAQQFTRAATLICACEYIRRGSQQKRSIYNSYNLGEEPISIGLWIGDTHIPNKNKVAKECLDKLIEATASNIRYTKERYNKFQVLKCPWCGTKLVKDKSKDSKKLIGQWGYKMHNNKHFYMSCPQESCAFNKRLPIQIIDEELYSNPPTLLFGTVDKFAMLPWSNEIGAFFGTGSSNRAPELIIQDELHLISGPLGTMVGLYETAVDAICEVKGIKPKIIASTATIRRAKEQCSSLYNREVMQFPPAGLESDDSFFAREISVSYKDGIYGRKYVGLMPTGKTKAMMEVRTIAALLQKVKTMDLPDEIRDTLWTLTVYFNSLKDLGKCSTLIDDDVKDFIKRMSYRLGTAKDARLINGADELTSRVSTTQLNETLDKLEKMTYSKENIEKRRYASNVLLATNMISVGIDISRLNVMLLVGQPKLTSEYIQSSSRIGRAYPGVAFTLFDGTKSRDRSHYEQFRAYHESFYKYVEPTGVTPFSKPARERALHGVIVSLMRHIEGLSTDKDAGGFDKENYKDAIVRIKQIIMERAKLINERANFALKDESKEIEDEIDVFFDVWDRLTTNFEHENFYYGKKFMFHKPDPTQGRLLKVFGTSDYDSTAYDTMTSMRNVDRTITGNILIWEEEL